MNKRTRPWCVKVETTQGCNRSCVFCPVPLIYGKRYNFIQPEIALEIAKQLRAWDNESGWRFELAMFGEPTMNPQLPEVIKNLKHSGRAQITVITNGDVLRARLQHGDDSLLQDLYRSGMNVAGIDCYDQQALNFYRSYTPPYYVQKFFYFEDKYPLYAKKKHGHQIRHMCIIDDIVKHQDEKTVRKFHNFGGNVDNTQFGIPTPTEPLKAGCEKPFRDLVISHKGDVILCCLDAKKELVIGNIFRNTLKEIWYSDFYMQIRQSLVDEQRIGRPCDTCSYYGGSKRFLAAKDWGLKKTAHV